MKVAELIHSYEQWRNDVEKNPEKYEEYLDKENRLRELEVLSDEYYSVMNFLATKYPDVREEHLLGKLTDLPPVPEEEEGDPFTDEV